MPPSTCLAAFLSAALLVACSQGAHQAEEMPEPTPTPQWTITPSPLPSETGPVELPPMAEGEWMLNNSPTHVSATYGPDYDQSRLTFSCEKDIRVLTLTLAGTANGVASYIVESGGTAARLDMRQVEGRQSMRAEIDIAAPVFGGFAVEGGEGRITDPGGAMMRVPGSPLIVDVFRACA